MQDFRLLLNSGLIVGIIIVVFFRFIYLFIFFFSFQFFLFCNNCYNFCLFDLTGGVAWSGEHAIAESVVMGYGG
jgi:hypothetical protein